MYIIWENKSFCWVFSENKRISIITIKTCSNNSEIKVRSQVLKNQDVDTVEMDRMAKGDSMTNSFIKIYLTE